MGAPHGMPGLHEPVRLFTLIALLARVLLAADDEQSVTPYYPSASPLLTPTRQVEAPQPRVAEHGENPPHQPAPPVHVRSNSTSISVSWTAPKEDGGTPILGYALYSGADGEPLLPIYDPYLSAQAQELRFNFTIRRLRPSSRYQFKVAARNAVGRSEFSTPVTFATTPPVPTVSLARPAAGPLRGGTRVRVHGADLVWGTSVAGCRFGEHVVPATLAEAAWPDRATTRAARRLLTEGDGRGVIECVSPRVGQRSAFDDASGEPLRLSSHVVALQVALDGRQFGAAAAVDYTFYDGPYPSVLSPASGPLAGGTSVTVTGQFPRADSGLFGRDGFDFPEAACNFSGAVVPATLLPLDTNHSDLHPPLTLAAPPPPTMPPTPWWHEYNASNATEVEAAVAGATAHAAAVDAEAAVAEQAAVVAALRMLNLTNGTTNETASPPPPPRLPGDAVNRSLVCVSPYVGEGSFSSTVVQPFSFGEGEGAVAALHESASPSYGRGASHARVDWAASEAAGDGVGEGEHEEPPPRNEELEVEHAWQGRRAEHAAASVLMADEARLEPPAGFVPLEVVGVAASSEHPLGGRGAAHLIDGSGLRLEADGRRLGRLCNGTHDLGCRGECWASDAEGSLEAQWVEFAFGRPRYVDMLHLYAYNSAHASAHLRSLASAHVQVPSSAAAGGWQTVGVIRGLPAAPRVDGDAGINVRRAGLPSYFVPGPYRRGSTLLTAEWLGFSTSRLRLARMTHHGADGYGASFGLCEAIFLEEDPTVSLQLVGASAVRARMLQLTPGASYAAAAAAADMFLPSTFGSAALDATARDMQPRLRRQRPGPGSAGGGTPRQAPRLLSTAAAGASPPQGTAPDLDGAADAARRRADHAAGYAPEHAAGRGPAHAPTLPCGTDVDQEPCPTDRQAGATEASGLAVAAGRAGEAPESSSSADGSVLVQV